MAVQLNLTDRRVLITGAGQGVGRGLALAFATAGADVVVNDLRAERAETNGAGYAAAKAGAAGLTRSLALETGRHGITANNITLGTMRTPLTEPLWAEQADSPQAKAILSGYAVRRPGLPEDVTHLTRSNCVLRVSNGTNRMLNSTANSAASGGALGAHPADDDRRM